MKDRTIDRQGIRDYKCPICKKTFSPVAEMWAYKLYSYSNAPILYCSWKCLRVAEAKHELEVMKRKENHKRHSEQKKRIIWDLLRQGNSSREIVDKTGLSFDTVRYWRERISDYAQEGSVSD